jgi:hypothetical protein
MVSPLGACVMGLVWRGGITLVEAFSDRVCICKPPETKQTAWEKKRITGFECSISNADNHCLSGCLS